MTDDLSARAPDASRVTQRATHENLVRRVSRNDTPPVALPPVDAIVVPAHRDARHLDRAAHLAAATRATLVVLASHDCLPESAEDVVARVPGCRALIGAVPSSHPHPLLDFRTSEPRFAGLSAGRHSDLSRKRQIGLLLARLSGWRKIMFLDDDMFDLTPAHLARVSAELDDSPVAGLIAQEFPDNSVVCHANRLSGHEQGNFITGGALGVNTADLPLDFFPDVYNEDWFFLAHRASTGGVSMVGAARQAPFNPFARGERAAEEEFGDLLAEGLFAAIDEGLFTAGPATQTRVPDHGYWRRFIESRQMLIDRIDADLERMAHAVAGQARKSMQHAQHRLATITPDDCLDFVEAWQSDRKDFARRSAQLPVGTEPADACAELGLQQCLGTGLGRGRAIRGRHYVPAA